MVWLVYAFMICVSLFVSPRSEGGKKFLCTTSICTIIIINVYSHFMSIQEENEEEEEKEEKEEEERKRKI